MGAGDRSALDAQALEQAWADMQWPLPRIVPMTGSTNADLADLARAGAAEGTCLTTDLQTAGRGRLDRRWEAPERSSVMASVLLRPVGADQGRWGWLPLIAGLAVARGITETTGLPVGLKWPNDVVVEVEGVTRKLAGVLVERIAADAVIVGFGINVDLDESELPVPEAASLVLVGAGPTSRERLLASVLHQMLAAYELWCAAAGDATRCGIRQAYAGLCVTMGRSVRVTLPGDTALEGDAVDIDGDGHLVVRVDGVDSVIAAGDIVHLRA